MEIIPQFTNFSYIGNGIYGHVLSAYDIKRECKVAIKRSVKKGNILSREIKINRILLNSLYVPKLYDVFYTVNDDGRLIQNLVFEYIESNFLFMKSQNFLNLKK